MQPVTFWAEDLVSLKLRLLSVLQEDPEQLNPDKELAHTTLMFCHTHSMCSTGLTWMIYTDTRLTFS